jgi:hypothetical protein
LIFVFGVLGGPIAGVGLGGVLNPITGPNLVAFDDFCGILDSCALCVEPKVSVDSLANIGLDFGGGSWFSNIAAIALTPACLLALLRGDELALLFNWLLSSIFRFRGTAFLETVSFGSNRSSLCDARVLMGLKFGEDSFPSRGVSFAAKAPGIFVLLEVSVVKSSTEDL